MFLLKINAIIFSDNFKSNNQIIKRNKQQTINLLHTLKY